MRLTPALRTNTRPCRVARYAVALCAWMVCAAIQAAPVTLQVNGRSYTLPSETPIVVNYEARTLADISYLRNGMQLQWHTPATAIAEGVAPTLIFSYTLIGPVSSTTPLAVLGQPLTVTADTTLGGFTDPATLQIGQQLVVSGLVDPNGSLLATLIERRPAPGNKYLLSGYVQELGVAAGDLRVGAQWVSASAVTFQDCVGGQPALGDYLELRATAVDPFPPGSTLNTVFDARCVAPVPAGTAGAVGFIQGMISAVPAVGSVEIGTLSVNYTAQTVFVFGALDDLEPGVAIAVDGNYVNANTFAADVIQFVRPVVRYEAPMDPVDVTVGVSLRPFDVTVLRSAQVRDEDNILASGLQRTLQVEVRGYLDSIGNAYATRVRERGNPDFNDTVLRGPVQAIAAPLLTIQGLVVDTTGASFVDEQGAAMTSTTFYATLLLDDIVDASAAVYNPTTHRLAATAMTLIGTEPVPPPPAVERAAERFVAGTASAYAPLDRLFYDGFD